ncbi:hypothetical protein [Streptomyces sp. NPDC048445]|uniref:hypothetical protein n=1 Tax=Streptomyces sp. NPDC048445 TaxID=3365553 RepID=UPI003710454A
MTTETTQPAPQAEVLPPKWQAHLQQAYTATQQAVAMIEASPFCVTQDQNQRSGAYAGNLHYLDTSSVKAFAEAYDVEVTIRGRVHEAAAIVSGTPVKAWCYAPDESGDIA